MERGEIEMQLDWKRNVKNLSPNRSVTDPLIPFSGAHESVVDEYSEN